VPRAPRADYLGRDAIAREVVLQVFDKAVNNDLRIVLDADVLHVEIGIHGLHGDRGAGRHGHGGGQANQVTHGHLLAVLNA
jgi:hypothetical protein